MKGDFFCFNLFFVFILFNLAKGKLIIPNELLQLYPRFNLDLCVPDKKLLHFIDWIEFYGTIIKSKINRPWLGKPTFLWGIFLGFF